jgi:hypothetical protein
MINWLRALFSETIFAIWFSLSGVSTLSTFFYPVAGRVRPILTVVTLVGFAWANFRVFQKQQARIATVTADSEQSIASWQSQPRDLQAQQTHARAQEANVAEEKRRRQDVANALAVFLSDGQTIQLDIQFNSASSLQRKKEWERRIEDYLSTNLGKPYVVRFQNPNHQVTSYPVGIQVNMIGQWADIKAKMAMLNDFISGLRD